MAADRLPSQIREESELAQPGFGQVACRQRISGDCGLPLNPGLVERRADGRRHGRGILRN